MTIKTLFDPLVGIRATSFDYVPALRLKAGELQGLDRLQADVADRIAPRFILPPPTDRDPEKRRLLTYDEILHETGLRIGRHWARRLALVEPRFLFKAFGDAESMTWLPRIFEVARHHNAMPVPVATLDDLVGARAEAFAKCLAEETPMRLALRVGSGEIDTTLADRVRAGMAAMQLDPAQCLFLLDLADADFSDPAAIAEFTSGALTTILGAGRWQGLVYQGTHYPEKNPAEPDSSTLVDRNEWHAWRMLIKSGGARADQVTFGDYGADCAKFVFRAGGAPAIRHYRYCTEKHWLVQRGSADVEMQPAMKSVCRSILASGMFAGRNFSSADNFIYQTAQGGSGGNATTWREINTAHHITRVIADLGKLRSFTIRRFEVADPPFQPSLFPAE